MIKTILFTLTLTSLVAKAGVRSAPGESLVVTNCDARETDVIGSLESLRDSWKVAPKGWTIDTGDNSSRSAYELYTRYIGLAFITGISPEEAMQMLDTAGVEGPKGQRGWGWEDHARMGEAAMITGRPVSEAMQFLKLVYSNSKERWQYIDYTRAAAAGFIAGTTPEYAAQVLHDAYKASRRWWSNGTFSRLAEAALTSGKSAEEAAKLLDEVYDYSNKISSGWYDNDYARVTRAALVKGLSAKQAVQVLADVYKETIKISSGWNLRDYSRMATAAIITGKSPKEAAEALKATWDARKIAPGWGYADYSTAAAAALIGKGRDPQVQCPAFFRAW